MPATHVADRPPAWSEPEPQADGTKGELVDAGGPGQRPKGPARAVLDPSGGQDAAENACLRFLLRW